MPYSLNNQPQGKTTEQFAEDFLHGGVDANGIDAVENIPLFHCAAKINCCAAFSALLSNQRTLKLEINKRDSLGKTALHYACLGDKPGFVLSLIDNAEINIDLKDADGNTAFDLMDEQVRNKWILYFAENNNFALVKALITAHKKKCPNASIDNIKEEKFGQGILHKAAMTDKGDPYQIIDLLIGAGASVHIQDALGYTPLHNAAFRLHEKAIDVLITNHAKINAANLANETPFIMVLTESNDTDMEKREKIALYFLERIDEEEISTRITSETQDTYQILATKLKFSLIFLRKLLAKTKRKNDKLILDHVNLYNEDLIDTGVTALHLAFDHPNADALIKAMKEAGVDLGVQDVRTGETVLHLIIRANTNTVQRLKDFFVGVDSLKKTDLVSKRQKNLATNEIIVPSALFIAVNTIDEKHLEILDLLLSDIDPHKKMILLNGRVNANDPVLDEAFDEKGRTLLHLAASLGKREVYLKLMEHGARGDIPDKCDGSQHHTADELARLKGWAFRISNGRVTDINNERRSSSSGSRIRLSTSSSHSAQSGSNNVGAVNKNDATVIRNNNITPANDVLLSILTNKKSAQQKLWQRAKQHVGRHKLLYANLAFTLALLGLGAFCVFYPPIGVPLMAIFLKSAVPIWQTLLVQAAIAIVPPFVFQIEWAAVFGVKRLLCDGRKKENTRSNNNNNNQSIIVPESDSHSIVDNSRTITKSETGQPLSTTVIQKDPDQKKSYSSASIISCITSTLFGRSRSQEHKIIRKTHESVLANDNISNNVINVGIK